jgi:GNAT superfamily N-acetyltransferase
MSELSIRPVTTETVAEDLARGLIDVHPSIANSLHDELARGDIDFWVAHVDGQSRGWGGISWNGPRNTDVREILENSGQLDRGGIMPNIAFVEVRGPYQHQGIGRLIMLKLHSAVQEKEFNRVFLMVNETNDPARHLYEDLGYTDIGSMQSQSFERNPDGKYPTEPTVGLAHILVKNLTPLADR